MILLDTNVFIWMAAGDSSLGHAARDAIERAREEDGLRVAAITLWEISMLNRKNKVRLEGDVLAWVETTLTRSGIRLEALHPSIAVNAERLPGNLQRDPADRMIVATARHLACPLLTSDREILAYAAQGHVSAINARR
ncbi:MAG TPA: type II toxin-antitoxin system VapC family toxin [Allosphingosinicella sp.]